MILCLDDFESAARRVLPRPIFGFVSGGAEDDRSLRGNRCAFDELDFIPRVLVDVSKRTQRTTVFGRCYEAPFGIAPMGGSSLAAFEGDLVLAREAAAAKIAMIQSGASLMPLERVAESGDTAWFQAYLPGDPATIAKVAGRAAQAGFETLVLAADAPVLANRENNLRSGYHTPLRPTPRLAWDCLMRPRWLAGTFCRTLIRHGMPRFENMGDDVPAPLVSRTAVRSRARRDGLGWEHLELLRRLWRGRLVVKGLLAAEDARLCRESGVDGVIVSNHGGRMLDGAVAPLRALRGVVAEAGEMTVMMDGGVRRGTDVLKALALGARFVFVGRPFLYAVAVAGEAGVRRAISLLRDEIDRDMAFLGVTNPRQLRPECLVSVPRP